MGIGGEQAEAVFILAEFQLLPCPNCPQLERSPSSHCFLQTLLSFSLFSFFFSPSGTYVIINEPLDFEQV